MIPLCIHMAFYIYMSAAFLNVHIKFSQIPIFNI